jgi:hypothetical protein
MFTRYLLTLIHLSRLTFVCHPGSTRSVQSLISPLLHPSQYVTFRLILKPSNLRQKHTYCTLYHNTLPSPKSCDVLRIISQSRPIPQPPYPSWNCSLSFSPKIYRLFIDKLPSRCNIRTNDRSFLSGKRKRPQ